MIDWTKPLESAIDGTPLVFSATDKQPDMDGDYVLVREDGEPFTHDQSPMPDWLIVGENGCHWQDRDGPVLVRNRDEPAPVGEREETAEVLTAEDEDTEEALLRWKLEKAGNDLRENRIFLEKRINENFAHTSRLNQEIENLRAQIDRLTASMTVAQLREAGFEVEIHG